VSRGKVVTAGVIHPTSHGPGDRPFQHERGRDDQVIVYTPLLVLRFPTVGHAPDEREELLADNTAKDSREQADGQESAPSLLLRHPWGHEPFILRRFARLELSAAFEFRVQLGSEQDRDV
jgi:hypothetical protein